MVLVLGCAAEFMVVVDASVVNVALPAIRDELAFSAGHLPWVVNAYALTFAGLLLLGGRLADLAGRREVLIAGMALFCGASLVGGLAPSPGVLIGARAIQGIGAALIAPASLSILTTHFPEGPRRTRALATWTAVAVGGGAAGNVLGGALTEYLSWRGVLLVNVPIGIAGVALALRALAARPRGGRGDLDIAGAGAVTAGLAALTYGVTAGAPAVMAVGAAGLAAFVWIERRGAAPLIPLRLFGLRSVTAGNVTVFLAATVLMPMWYFLTLAMQDVLGFSAIQAGLGFLPHALITIAVSVRVTPWAMRHASERALVIGGSLVAALGFLWQGQLEPGATYAEGILGPAVLMAVGGGLLNTPLTTLVNAATTEADAGAASGLMNTTKQMGAVLGLAALVAVGLGVTDAFVAMAVLAVLTALSGAALPGPHRSPRPTREAAIQ